jgi:hypothetical protein
MSTQHLDKCHSALACTIGPKRTCVRRAGPPYAWSLMEPHMVIVAGGPTCWLPIVLRQR